MNNEDFNIDLDIESLRNSYNSLVKGYKMYSSANEEEQDIIDMYADSCIKRFEYTYETAWKTMKKYLKLVYNKREEELTMNNIFRFMEGYGFTESWLRWREYNTQRNNTAHEYNVEKARKLIQIIPEFLNDVQFLINKWDSL